VTRSIEVLTLPAALAARIRQEARLCYPREACGFLVGDWVGNHARVRQAQAAANRATRNDRFLIEAADVFATMQAARAHGEEILGVYHSHPEADAVPSETDRAEAWGEWLHLIVACRGSAAAEMKCWRHAGDSFVAVDIQTEAT